MLRCGREALDLVAVAHAELEPEVLLPALVLPEIVRRHVHAIDRRLELLDRVAFCEARFDCAPLFARGLRSRVGLRVLRPVVPVDLFDFFTTTGAVEF